MTGKGGVGQGLVNDRVSGHRPGALGTGGQPEGPAMDAKSTQGVEPSFGMVPPQPEAFAHVSSDPASLVFHFPAPIRPFEVVPPAHDVPSPL